MSIEPMRDRRRHMPTKLQVEDRFELGHGFSFTWRQGGLVLTGLVFGYLVWKGLSVPLAPLGTHGLGWVSIVPAALVILLFWAVAIIKIQGRTPENWFAVWFTYRQLPRVYLWQPLVQVGIGNQNARGKAVKREPALARVDADTEEEDAIA
jgi:hypothetical protein